MSAWFVLLVAIAAPTEQIDNPRAPASESIDAAARARALFEQSETAFLKGDTTLARQLLKRAYALDPHPLLLYNLARVEEVDGQPAEALKNYQAYLRAAPDAVDRALVKKRVASLEAELAERAQRASDVLQYSGAPPRDPLGIAARKEAEEQPNIAGPITLISIGTAGLIAGGILGLVAKSKNDDAQRSDSQADAVRLTDQASDLALGANIAYAAAGTALVAGGLWWLLQATTSD
ncbi:MAG: hypothetical protein AAFN74_26605 [Myxococcota bacterium]